MCYISLRFKGSIAASQSNNKVLEAPSLLHHLYIYTFIQLYIHTSIHLYIYTVYIYTFTHLYVYTFAYTYILNIYICLYIYTIYIHNSIYRYIHGDKTVKGDSLQTIRKLQLRTW